MDEITLFPVAALARFARQKRVAGRRLTLYLSGIPRFPCIHLRDSFYTGLITDALPILRDTALYALAGQGRKRNPLNGEEPGKMLHEDAAADVEARSNRYNACDTTALFFIALERYTRLSGDTGPLLASRPAMERAVRDYLLPHLSPEGLFLEGLAFSGGDHPLELAVTYWKDSRLPRRAGDIKGGIPAYPVTYTLAQAQNLAGLRAASILLAQVRGGELAEAAAEAVGQMRRGLAQLWCGDQFVLALDQLGPLPAISSDLIHLLAFLRPGDLDPAQLLALVRATQRLETPLGYRTLDPALAYPNDHLSLYHSKTLWPFEQAVIHQGARRHQRWAEEEGLPEVAEAMAHVAAVSTRITARLDLDRGWLPETYLLTAPQIDSLESPAIQRYGCPFQLWTAAARVYFERVAQLRQSVA